MKDYPLKNIDAFDLSDFLKKVERAYNIEFEEYEFNPINTVGELCTHIISKIELEDKNDCTSQQAFYKLRESVSEVLQIGKGSINPQTHLTDLLPKQNRRLLVQKTEEHLGFKLNILRPPYWLSVVLVVVFITSFIWLFFNWQTGVVGVLSSIVGFWFAGKMGYVFELRTIGEVARRMTMTEYFKSRRNPNTFNKKELEGILMNWIKEECVIKD